MTDPWTVNILLVLNHGSVKTEPYFHLKQYRYVEAEHSGYLFSY